MKPDSKPLPSRSGPRKAESHSTGQTGGREDGILNYLRRKGLPVNRSTYVGLRFADPSIKPEDDLGGEIEASIRPGLRHPNYNQD